MRVACVMWVLVGVAMGQTPWWEQELQAPLTEERRVADDHRARIDWEKGYLEVTAGATCNVEKAKNNAQCYGMALKAARHFALEKMAEIVYGVRLDANNLFVNEVEQDATLRTTTQGIIKGAREVAVEQTQFPDGSLWVSVTMGIVLNGEKGLVSAVVPWLERQRQTAPPAVFAARSPEPVEATGLIVDATGLGLKPAMAPRILVQGTLEEVFGRANIDRTHAIKHGVVGYTDSVDKAKALVSRVGQNPLVVRAAGVSGAYSADVVITPTDAAKVVAANMVRGFLKECRVVFVVG